MLCFFVRSFVLGVFCVVLRPTRVFFDQIETLSLPVDSCDGSVDRAFALHAGNLGRPPVATNPSR